MCYSRMTAFLLVTVLLSAMQGVRADLVHRWEFEGNTNDSVGGWNGTGGIGFGPGKVGQAATFGGTAGSDITFTFNTAGLKNITVAFWMKLDTAWTPGKAGIGRVMGSADNFECVLGPSGGGTGQVANNFFISGGTYPLSTTIPTPDTWYHVTLISSLSTAGGTGRAEVWINGVMEAGQDNRAVNDWTSGAFAFGQRPGAGGYRFPGLLDDVRIYNTILSADQVAGIMLKPGGDTSAASPFPADKATDVARDAILSWTPLPHAKTHNVYLGTGFEDVNIASTASPKGVLVSLGQDANTCDPAGLLALGQTYYWRVDEVNAAPDSTIFRGSVWSFTAEPVAYPIKTVTATASSSQSADMGPEKTVDGSGLNGLDQHSISATQMWLSKKGTSPAWIQYQLDTVYKLHEMWVWNSNQAVESVVGFGAKDVAVETSLDGTTWTAVPNVAEFSQALGESNYAHNTTVNLGGAVAKYVRLTIASNWADSTSQAGLSEVRFFYIPVWAREPKPASGAANVDPRGLALSWRAGREAVSHQVCLGSNQAAVVDGSALVGTVSTNRYDPSALGLQLDQTYYWKVTEVNDAATPKSWPSNVWSFSTPSYLVVDDFETYDDACNRIFFAWPDGFGYSASPDCGVAAYAGNGTGSAVGNLQPPFAERTVVHGGRQSMPFTYDSTAGKSSSEAERILAAPQDWTQGGVKTLVLYFSGDPANAAGRVYVKINGTKVVYAGNADAIKTPFWTQWNVDLASVATNLKAVTKLTFGVDGTTGRGTLYIDDIRLYRTAPAAAKEWVWIEAESAATLSSPMKKYDDPTASGGKYIGTENLGITAAHLDGIATYSMTVKGGTYKIYGRVIDQPTGRNSFFVRVKGATLDATPDADGWVTWNFPNGAAWHWDNVRNGAGGGTDPIVHFTLKAGTYTLEIAYREDGARLDAVVITDGE